MFCAAIFTLNRFILVIGFKFTADSISEIDVLANKGKDYLESINEKANVPHYGSCWKNAVADLEIGCRYLSENVQSDLALRFTNCFMQMSGLGPVVCREPKQKCLKSLTDRAFNAFVEFYTHTQSMCYFLQSQIWHEEAERTIEKLSLTSMHVSNQLEEAEKIQEQLLFQQKQSLLMQHDLLDNSKSLATELQVSRDRINVIMKEFQSSTEEQKKVLFDLFSKFSSLKTWAIEEMSWLNSITFYAATVILAYFFTSTSRTQQARLYLFLLLTCNYIVEQYLYSAVIRKANDNSNLSSVTDTANSLVWLCRKVFVFLCITVTLIAALKYCDYNLINYHLLLEIKNQNFRLLNLNLTQNGRYRDYKPTVSTIPSTLSNNLAGANCSKEIVNEKIGASELSLLPYQPFKIVNSSVTDGSPSRYSFKSKKKLTTPKTLNYDATDNTSNMSKSSEKSVCNVNEIKETYNLRSGSRLKTRNAN